MGIFELILIGIGLSMDAMAVSVTNSMVYNLRKGGMALAMPVMFGGFQALMPILGFFAGGVFSQFIQKYAGIVAFLILGAIGLQMIREGLEKKEEVEEKCCLTWWALLCQGVATSIDAFAVGISFSAMQVEIFPAAAIIGVSTLVCSTFALLVGSKMGHLLRDKGELLGGAILILIGIKSLLS